MTIARSRLFALIEGRDHVRDLTKLTRLAGPISLN